MSPPERLLGPAQAGYMSLSAKDFCHVTEITQFGYRRELTHKSLFPV